MKLWLIVLLIQALSSSLLAETEVKEAGLFLKPERIEYIKKGLNSLEVTPKEKILNTYRFLRSLRSNLCISISKQLEVQCVIEKAESNCKSLKRKDENDCRIYSDILNTVILEESRIVSRSEKAKLAKNKQKTLAEAVQDEVQRHYAILSLDMMGKDSWNCRASDWNCVSRNIYDYCEDYSLSRKGSWQGCVSGLVYFIGVSNGKRDI